MTLRLIFAVLLLSTSLFAQNAFIKENTTVYDQTKQYEIGMISFATPIKVLEKNKEFSKITVSGWVPEGGEDVVYSDVGVILEYSVLNEKGIESLKKKSTKLDEYETQWTKVELSGWIKTNHLISTLNDEWNKLNILYSQRCGACHGAPVVSHFDANTWPGLLDSMSDRAALSPSEKAKVLKYLQYNAAKAH